MLFRQMKYFVTIVECNSFTEAAQQLYISQSAISQQMQALEKELGVELLHREKRSFSLTPAGEYFYRHSKGILEEAEQIKRETVRIGSDKELQLRIGYLRCYSGLELHQVIAEFSATYPEVEISIVNGTHEELYNGLRFGEIDLVLNDQRRAFSEEYVNYELLKGGCYVEISRHHRLSDREQLTMEDLRMLPCILISSREQQNTEQDYYQNTLGFAGNFLFAENLEEGRLMVVGGRGFLPVESIGTLPPTLPNVCRLPLYRGNRQLERNYCAFWKKETGNYYIEEFAEILRRSMVKV